MEPTGVPWFKTGRASNRSLWRMMRSSALTSLFLHPRFFILLDLLRLFFLLLFLLFLLLLLRLRLALRSARMGPQVEKPGAGRQPRPPLLNSDTGIGKP